MKKRMMMATACWMLTSVTLAACGGNGPAPDGAAAGGKEGAVADKYANLRKPVTIVLQSAYNETDTASVEKTMFSRIRQKFPNVTPVYIQRGKGTTIQDLITAGTIPDILWGNLSSVNELILSTDLGFDLTGLAKKYNYDLSQFSPTALEGIKNTNEKGELLGLPKNNLKPAVLFYNKDLFDKFGVPYPKDGMTWDQTYELAKKMTRMENGDQINGFTMFPNAVLRDNALSVPAMDSKEDKLQGSDQWAEIFQNFKRFFDIPGNEWKDQAKKFREGKAAMYVDLITSHGAITKSAINWDIASLPVYKEKPGVGSRIPYDYYFVTKTSANKEAAFELLTYLLSEEFQLGDAKDGMLPSTSKINILNVFGENVEGLRSKNLKALTVNKPADALPRRSQGLSPINTDMNISKAFERAVTGAADVNTSLRKADEEIRKAAEADKAKNKK